jgi:hypothetical protein
MCDLDGNLKILRIETVGVDEKVYPLMQSPLLSSLSSAMETMSDLGENTKSPDVHFVLLVGGECFAWTEH